LDYFIVWLLALILFAWLQASATLPEPDSFYHAKMAELLGQGQILHQLPWLQETALNSSFVDHHFLYHLLLVPFVKVMPPLLGVKLATVIFASLAVALVYRLFKKFEIKWPFLFVSVLLVSQPWLFRASLVKAPVVLLSLVILSFYCLSHHRHWCLAVISFLAVWLYAGWPLIPAMAIIYILIIRCLEKFRKDDSIWFKVKSFLSVSKNQIVPWRGGLYCLGGVLAGIAFNPYFPNNLIFYWQQIVQIALINYQKVIGVGGEWYPYGFWQLISDAAIVCALLIVSWLLFIITIKKQSVYSWTWGLLALVFFVLTLKSRRNVEFFIPFSVIFSAFVFTNYFNKFSFNDLLTLVGRKWRVFFQISGLLIILIFAVHAPADVLAVKKDIKNGWPLDHYLGASQWLIANSPEGAIVFHADWDDFPFLFYHNSHNYYLVGLDPTFMYQKDPGRYQQYVDVTLGKQRFDLKQIIRGNFNARYVFLDSEHISFNNNLRLDPGFKLVYQDHEGKVYQIVE